MGALASLEQREEVRRSLKALLSAGRIVFGDPDHVDVVGADAERGAFMSPMLLQADDADRAEPHEVEAFGPVSTLIGYRDTGAGDRARRPRPGQPGRLGRHRRRRLRPRRGPRPGAVARPAARARPRRRAPSPPATARRCRCWCTAARAGPAAARRWAASAACCTTCSARRCRPARGCSRAVTGRWVAGRRAGYRRRPPVPQVAGRAADRRRRGRRPAHGHRWPTSSTSPSSPATPSTRTWTRRPRAANPFFDGGVAHGYLVVSLRGRAVRRARPGPGAGQLRPGQPALPHAGLPGRRADRDADLQADHARAGTPSTARCAGTPT